MGRLRSILSRALLMPPSGVRARAVPERPPTKRINHNVFDDAGSRRCGGAPLLARCRRTIQLGHSRRFNASVNRPGGRLCRTITPCTAGCCRVDAGPLPRMVRHAPGRAECGKLHAEGVGKGILEREQGSTMSYGLFDQSDLMRYGGPSVYEGIVQG